ncbi:histidine phosphatase family protein [Nocardioides okcheonensis]|uniref:histidine phosphatase family protein n=1 Tax=Nocardioides okcheonensis TaxID=2894081 RepID=UPI001E38B33E|nr:histidine phosphatase family protein [Nocardioides okcheonensis]UFN43539.1 histidine phosphatase family protein [Nocardioides okcheonensis]
MGTQTIVHLLRHGEVHNPRGVLYGRMDGFHLSDLGRRMAQRIADSIGDRDIVHVRTSPLERARETGAPLAAVLGLEPVVDTRVIESGSKFQGVNFGAGAKTFLKNPGLLRHMYNPMKPSWGEPYDEIAGRMLAAVHDARDVAAGHEAVVVSHQLPIWTTRLFLEKRSYLHHPRTRQCTLCSLTSIVFDDERVVQVRYSEPAGDLIPVGDRSAPFSSGGAAQEDRS